MSTLVVLIAIIFEGRFKRDNNDNRIINLKSEFLRLSNLGWILITLTILMNLGNGYVTYKSIVDSEEQYTEDTIRYTKLLNESYDVNLKLKKKSIADSIRINKLERLSVNNGLKSDSIRQEVFNNSIKTIEEHRNSIERERQNTYVHMLIEIEDNLTKVYRNFQEDHIRGFLNIDSFIKTRLKNKYIIKYGSISSNYSIVDQLAELSEIVVNVNDYADLAWNYDKGSYNKQISINMLLSNIQSAESYLLSLYIRTAKIDNYKEFETLDFKSPLPNFDKKSIESNLRLKNNKKLKID